MALLVPATSHAAKATKPDAGDPRLAATSSSKARQDARAAIPWNDLELPEQRLVRYVVRNASLFRRMPTRVVECDPEALAFLVRRPEVVTSIWNLMGISTLKVERLSEGAYRAVDEQGAEGQIRVLHADRQPATGGTTVVYVDGQFQQPPMPRPLKAKCVLVLRDAATDSGGRSYVTARLDAFVKFDRVAADVVARTIQPIVAGTADHNFVETVKFASTFSRTAERNLPGMQRLADRLTDVDPAGRQEMLDVCRRTHERARGGGAVRLARLREGEG